MDGNILLNACHEIFDCLKNFDYDALANIIDKYNNYNIFKHNYFRENTNNNQEKLFYIKFLNEDTPEILKNVPFEEMLELRQNAIFNFLFSSASKKLLISNKDLDFNFHLSLLKDYAWKKAMLFYQYFQYKEFFPTRKYIIRIENCENCYKCLISYQLYDIENVPQLPYIFCSNDEKKYKCYYKLIHVYE